MKRVLSRIAPLVGLGAALLTAVVAVRAWRGEQALARGREAQNRGDLNTADAGYREALGSGDADAALERARLQLRRRDWDGAAGSVRTALSLAPARGAAHALRVELEASRPGDWDDAREQRVLEGCRAAVALEQKQPGVWLDCAGIMTALATRRRVQWDQARTRQVLDEAANGYAEALRLAPSSGAAVLEKALALNRDPAFLAQVVVRRGGDSGFAPAVGLLLDRGLWEAAGPAWLDAADQSGVLPAFALAAAERLAARGRTREALATVRRGLLAEPGDQALRRRSADLTARLGGPASGNRKSPD